MEKTMHKTRHLLFVLLFGLALPVFATAQPQSANSSQAEAAVRAVLEKQVGDWNAGRLEEFMAGYWRSPKLTFFSGGRRTAGWDATIERYRKTYQAEGKEMGKLQFSDLDIQSL